MTTFSTGSYPKQAQSKAKQTLKIKNGILNWVFLLGCETDLCLALFAQTVKLGKGFRNPSEEEEVDAMMIWF